MNRITILTLFVLASCLLYGQDTINNSDGNGFKQGYWRKLDTAGHIIYEGRFKNGVPSGEFRYYYPDGKLKTVSKVSKMGKRAVTVSYFPNGRKMAAGNYVNEKKDSAWQFFSEYSDAIVSEEFYQAGLINGLSRVFYPEGGLSELLDYKNGIKDGRWEQYYLDGKLKLRGTYKTGEKHGPFNAWYNSGQIMITGQYFDGHQDGTWIYYDDKGTLTKKEIYDKGALVKIEGSGK